jgi:hypothetical protein
MDVPLRFVIPWRLAGRAMGRKMGLWSFLRPLSKPCLMPVCVRCFGGFFRLHFQYLCAFEQPGFYDYFQITAGPSSLRDRFQERAPSPSRIVAQTTRYGGAQ